MYRHGRILQVSLKSIEAEHVQQQRKDLMQHYKMDCSGLIKHLIAKEHYLIRKQLNLI
jgi:hypothetical protein